MKRLTTIKTPVTFEGVSPFSLQKTVITIKPRFQQGYVFVVNGNEVPVDVAHTLPVANGKHTTLVSNAKARVRFTEHILSALAGLEIDGAIIELDGEEVPALDGSAKTFTNGLESVRGETFEVEDSKYKEFVVKEEITFEYDGSKAVLLPSLGERSELKVEIEFPKPVGNQAFSFERSGGNYLLEVAWARTFIRRPVDADGWAKARKEVPMLPEDITQSPILVANEKGRWIVKPLSDDEPARHKMLDLVGDLATLGMPIVGDIYVNRPGHEFNRRLVRYLAGLWRG